jgi:hypothetical protein
MLNEEKRGKTRKLKRLKMKIFFLVKYKIFGIEVSN